MVNITESNAQKEDRINKLTTQISSLCEENEGFAAKIAQQEAYIEDKNHQIDEL